VADALPPVEQIFSANAAAYLAAVEDMVAATDELAESIDLAAESAERLGAAGAGADASAAGDDAAAEAAQRLADAASEAAEAQERLAESAESAGAAADGLAASLDAAAVAADRTAAGETAAGDEAEAAGAKADESGASFAGFGSKAKLAFLAVAAGAVYSVVEAAKFNAEITRLNTQAGVAKNQLASLGQGVLQLAGQVGESPDSLAESLYHVESNFASLGITSTKALSLVQIAAEGARVGNANLVDVTNALTAAVASGIPGVQNFSQAMGVLNATVGAGDMTMQDLSDAFGTGMVAAVKLYGLSIKDVGAALDVFGDNNIRGAKAGTDLRMAVQALAVPLATAGPELAKMGMNAQTLADDMRHGGLMAALDDLQERFRKTGITADEQGEAITDIFGKKAGVGLSVLMDQMDRLQSKYPALTKGADDFGEAWKTTTQTPAQQMADLRASLDSLAISFGEVLLPDVLKITSALNKFFGYVEKHPLLERLAGALIAVATAAGILTGVMAGLGAVLEINPVVAITLAVIALAVGLYELYKHCKTVRDIVADVAHFFESAWQQAMKAAGAVVTWFVHGPLALIKQEIAVFSAWWDAHSQEISEVTKAVWDYVSAVIRLDWEIAYDFIKAGLGDVEAVWRFAWDLIRDTVRTVWDLIASDIRIYVTLITGVIGIGLDLITGHWSKAWHDLLATGRALMGEIRSSILQFVGNFGTLLFDAGRNLVMGLADGIRSAIGAVTSAIGSVAGEVLAHIPHSPAKKGPLSGPGDPVLAGRRTAQMYAEGLASGSAGVEAAMRALAGGGLAAPRIGGLAAAAMAGAGGGASAAAGGSTVINVNVAVPGGFIGSAQDLRSELYPLVQQIALEVNRRTPGTGNGLVLPGRAT
jgi:TP901 family phage tail tape measure protein